MILKTKSETKVSQKYKDACSYGYCPSLTDRENKRIKELASRLKSNSKKETLTNILEWQNNNLTFWFEREPLSWILIVSLAFIPASLASSLILGDWIAIVFGAVFVTLLLITILLLTYHRRISIKHFFKIFWLNLSPDFMIEKKLAVCRDYTKLSANLLFNIYPEIDVYFVHATRHVATGIFVDEKLYIIDKYLPVVTIDKWHEKWNKGRFSEKAVEKARGTSMESIDLESLLSKSSKVKLDTISLANEMKKRLHIKSSNAEVSYKLDILTWKKGAILYEDDEIVNHSLARWLSNMISTEMLEINQLIDLEINACKNDLNFIVTFRTKY